MTLRLMVALSVGVAALVLIPVLLIVGLGVYGSSLGGSAKSVAGSGAELRLLPARGFAGSAVAIQGRQWPPRKTVSLYVRRPDLGSTFGSLRLRIDQVRGVEVWQLRGRKDHSGVHHRIEHEGNLHRGSERPRHAGGECAMRSCPDRTRSA